jgi:methyl-accepting chemotaxis protein
MKQVADSMTQEAIEADQRFDTTADSTIRTALIVGIAATAALLVASLLMVRSILHPLGIAREVTARIAGGDLSTAINTDGKDEFSQMLRSCDTMQSTLRDVVRQLQDNSQQIAAMSEELAATTQQIAGATDQQSQSASSMAASVEEMSVSITHMSDHARDVRMAVTRSGEMSKEGRDVIDHLLGDNEATSAAVELAADRIKDLEKLSEQISSIVRVISDIASQTNLLALNAAIEAARAGEQGRGFAVVADEVRKLAERTGQSTQDISQMIDQVQTVTLDVVENMTGAVKQVRAGSALSQQANGSITQIQAQSQSVVVAVEEITNALAEQSTASNDIARRVEQIAQMSEENSAAVQQSATAASELEQMASQMQALTARFKLA